VTLHNSEVVFHAVYCLSVAVEWHPSLLSCSCWFGDQGTRLESMLSSAGDYEVWLTTQLLHHDMDDFEFSSQVLSEADTLPLCTSQPFDSQSTLDQL